MYRKAFDIFSEKAIRTIKKAIKDCDNREVLFFGNFDNNKKIEAILPFAYGNEYSVPSLMKTASDYDIILHNHPTGDLAPSDNDIMIADRLSGSYGMGFYIIDNNAENLYTVVEFIGKKKIKKLDPEQLQNYFCENGILKNLLSHYEYRPEQKDLVADIIDSFNENKFAIVEAGTGTGKSLAYLVPSIIWARTNNTKVIISTKTINLQQQLIQKDLPILMKDNNLKIEYDYALGRNNFVCIRKLSYLTQEDNTLFDDDIDLVSIDSLIKWAYRSSTGLRSEYSSSLDNELWLLISSDHEKCHRIKCPHYERCFYFKHKRRLSSCDIIITNHYLLAYDIFLKHSEISFDESALLPPFKHIIIDEAHHIEDIMSKCFTMEISNSQIYKLLREIHNPAKNRGILINLLIRQNRFASLLLERNVIEALSKTKDLIKTVISNISQIFADLETAYEKLIIQTDIFQKNTHRYGRSNNGENKIRIEDGSSDYYLMVKDVLLNIFDTLSSLYLDIKSIFLSLDSLPPKILEIMDMDFLIIRSIFMRLKYIIAVFESLFNLENDRVYWIEHSTWYNKYHYKIANAPILVGEFLNDALYTRLNSLVATSATLNVDDNFTFFEERTGLKNIPSDQKINRTYRSSFLSDQRAVILIPRGMALPSEDNIYREDIIVCIHQLMGHLEGGVLILFTSRAFMNEAYEKLKDLIPVFGKIPMRQGDVPRHMQLIEFKKAENGVLFALDSFWEGIDIPGRSLQNIIIPRLPFKSPSDPIEQARYRYIEKQRKNAFYEYALPKAVLLLKQGFGRLIRSSRDKGAVIILDSRVKQKNYGRHFLNALPPCRVVYDDINAIIDTLHLHYKNTE